MLCLPHSTAKDRVIANTPAFPAADGTTKGEPVHAYVVTILKTFPFLFLIISLPIVLIQFHVPINTISITVLNALGLNISVGEIKLPAALFSRLSIFPNLSIACLVINSTSSNFLTSPGHVNTLIPSSENSWAVSSNTSALLPLITMFAPSSPNRLDILFPKPVPPPVMTIVWSFSNPSLNISIPLF